MLTGNVLSVLLSFNGPLGRFWVSFRGSTGPLCSSYNPSGSSSSSSKGLRRFLEVLVVFLDSSCPLEGFSGPLEGFGGQRKGCSTP